MDIYKRGMIIAHRGFWKNSSEQNTIFAFERALKGGYGIETDVRDFNEELVISHDIPISVCYSFEEFLLLYVELSHNVEYPPCLAINIKSDGLQNKVKSLLEKYQIKNYFLFDMSVPDTFGYIAKNLTTFSRVSELEGNDTLNEISDGIWLDQFYDSWYDGDFIIRLVEKYNKVCVVSPELHKREHIKCWKMISKLPVNIKQNLMLCTDFPEEAKGYF
jgi:hypothetical protein